MNARIHCPSKTPTCDGILIQLYDKTWRCPVCKEDHTEFADAVTDEIARLKAEHAGRVARAHLKLVP